MLGYSYGGLTVLIAALPAEETARQSAFTYVVIPFLIACILAVAIIMLFVFSPQWFTRGVGGLRTAMGRVGPRKWPDNPTLDKVLEDTGFTYDTNQDIFYSTMDAWQRSFGYCRLYDEAAAPMSMIIDCEPIHFDYAGKKWLIELWKGQYGMTTGGEIGVFATDKPEVNIPEVFTGTFYYSVPPEDELPLSFALLKDDKVLFTRVDTHWWLTGFKLGEFSEPAQLTMNAEIGLKDQEMLVAFVKGLKTAGYADKEIIISGNSVSLQYGVPHSPQPATRTAPTDWVIQRKNELLCKEYQRIASEYYSTPDAVKALGRRAPHLIDEVRDIRKTRHLAGTNNTITNYINKQKYTK